MALKWLKIVDYNWFGWGQMVSIYAIMEVKFYMHGAWCMGFEKNWSVQPLFMEVKFDLYLWRSNSTVELVVGSNDKY